MALSSILAGIVKWYIIMLFVGQGTTKLGLEKLTLFMDNLLEYIPNAILGILVIIVALMIANFMSMRIKRRKLEFGEILSLGMEAIVIFFGIVLALPKFGVENAHG